MRKRMYRDIVAEMSSEESSVVDEVINRGAITVQSLRRALGEKKIRLSAKEIEACLRSLRLKGWVHRTNWRWHVTDVAVQYMR